jgi:hypothetical protein
MSKVQPMRPPDEEDEEEDAANILSQYAGKKKSDINALVGNQEAAPTTYDITIGENTFTFDITSGRISQPFLEVLCKCPGTTTISRM